jgi:hypothetical protein
MQQPRIEDINSRRKWDDTITSRVTQTGQVDVARMLIERGADAQQPRTDCLLSGRRHHYISRRKGDK